MINLALAFDPITFNFMPLLDVSVAWCTSNRFSLNMDTNTGLSSWFTAVASVWLQRFRGLCFDHAWFFLQCCDFVSILWSWFLLVGLIFWSWLLQLGLCLGDLLLADGNPGHLSHCGVVDGVVVGAVVHRQEVTPVGQFRRGAPEEGGPRGLRVCRSERRRRL